MALNIVGVNAIFPDRSLENLIILPLSKERLFFPLTECFVFSLLAKFIRTFCRAFASIENFVSASFFKIFFLIIVLYLGRYFGSVFIFLSLTNPSMSSIICRTDIFSSKRNNDLPAPRSDGGIIISESGLDKRLRIPFRYCKLILES